MQKQNEGLGTVRVMEARPVWPGCLPSERGLPVSPPHSHFLTCLTPSCQPCFLLPRTLPTSLSQLCFPRPRLRQLDSPVAGKPLLQKVTVNMSGARLFHVSKAAAGSTELPAAAVCR